MEELKREQEYEISTKERFEEFDALIRNVAKETGLVGTPKISIYYSAEKESAFIKNQPQRVRSTLSGLTAMNINANELHSFPNIWEWKWQLTFENKRWYKLKKQYRYAYFRLEFTSFSFFPRIKVAFGIENSFGQGTIVGLFWDKINSVLYVKECFEIIASKRRI